jgi:hypothetical protein
MMALGLSPAFVCRLSKDGIEKSFERSTSSTSSATFNVVERALVAYKYYKKARG